MGNITPGLRVLGEVEGLIVQGEPRRGHCTLFYTKDEALRDL